MRARCMPRGHTWISAPLYSYNLLSIKDFVNYQEPLGKHVAFSVRGQVKLFTLQGPTKLSDKEHSLAHFRQQCKCMHDLRKMDSGELPPKHMLQVAPKAQCRL